MSVYERFILEPRAKYNSCGGSHGTWLVARDTTTDSYVLEDGSNKKYVKFNNSKEAFDYLKSIFGN